MARKVPRGLVALSSSAIAAIYAAGYIATQGADARLGVADAAPATAITAPTRTPTRADSGLVIPRLREQERDAERPFGRARPGQAAPPSAAAPASPSTPATPTTPSTGGTTASIYRDGTYQGSGTSRRGGVAVAVTIQGGRITDVTFTQVTTQYPGSRIAMLPAQVVARQSAQVDRITGATYSVQAFQQAVQQALAKASA